MFSPLHEERMSFQVPVPAVLSAPGRALAEEGGPTTAAGDEDRIEKLFPTLYGKPRVVFEAREDAGDARPVRLGCLLSGGQAPGGHNVIIGLYDFAKSVHRDSVLIGFLRGPKGLFTGEYTEVTQEMVDRYRNTGGFDMIGSGRDKIESEEQFAASLKYATDLELDGLVVTGGDDSNTNAAVLAEYFASHGSRISVVGCPKTIDGDLRAAGSIPISFGFDTAARVYSSSVGCLETDALSSRKYWYFVRVMGRSASHLALEVALQTQPNVCMIGEEVAARRMNLAAVTGEIVKAVVERWKEGKDYGVVVLPEGLIEFIPEMESLLHEINDLMAAGTEAEVPAVQEALSANNAALFSYLPEDIKRQMLADRDPHGNVQLSKIEMERLVCRTVQQDLDRLRRRGEYSGSFAPQFTFLGYEGRSAFPSDFDASYCYALGRNAGALLAAGATGMVSSVRNLAAPISEWVCGGVPLTSLMNMERRHGKDKPVIRKALVDLADAPFRVFAQNRHRWAIHDCYRDPGPIQYAVPGDPVDGALPLCHTLRLQLEAESSAAAAAADEDEHHDVDIKAYEGFLDGMLADGTMSSAEAHKLLLFRLKHGITDDEHEHALRSIGWTLEKFHAVEAQGIQEDLASTKDPHAKRQRT